MVIHFQHKGFHKNSRWSEIKGKSNKPVDNAANTTIQAHTDLMFRSKEELYLKARGTPDVQEKAE